MRVRFDGWTPDAARLGSPGVQVAINVVPGPNGFRPVPSLQDFTNALDEYCRGAIEARSTDGSVFQYAGDRIKLYHLVGENWTDVSNTGGYNTQPEEAWALIRWKEKIIASNFDKSTIEHITFGDAQFLTLVGFGARHLSVVRDFVVAGNTRDATDGEVRNRVRWSAFGDETQWTPSPSTLSDFQDIRNGGQVQGIVGGEFGIIVMERSTFRMTWAGAPTVFQFDEILPGVGTFAPGSIVRLAERVYFMSEHGIVEITSGSGVRFPGSGIIDQFLLKDIDRDYAYRVTSVADPTSGRVFWSYPGSQHHEGTPNRVIVYDSTFDRWSLIENELEFIWRGGGEDFTLDELDNVSTNIDDIRSSFDSNRWKGGVALFSGFNPDHEHGFFDGPFLPATLETGEFEFNEGYRTQLKGFEPLIDGGGVTANVISRQRQTDGIKVSPTINQLPTGRFTTRVNARFHTFRLNIATSDWKDAIGINIDRLDAKRAGRRG